MSDFADATQSDNDALAEIYGEDLVFRRQGVYLRPGKGTYTPRTEVVTPYTAERTIQRASITLLRPEDAAGLLVTDTVVIPGVGERKLFGQPSVNSFGWTTWELVS